MARLARGDIAIDNDYSATQWVERAHANYVELQRESLCAIEGSRKAFRAVRRSRLARPGRSRPNDDLARRPKRPANAPSDHRYGHEGRERPAPGGGHSDEGGGRQCGQNVRKACEIS